MQHAPTAERQATILVVDDNQDNVLLLKQILTKHDYHVQTASDGLRAMMLALDAPPDLILMDILMPGMDGYEVCQRLKNDERTRDVPVIFISALSEIFDKVRAFSSGAVDYISKPFQIDEVRIRVETHLALRRMQAQQQEQNVQLQREVAERKRAEEALRESQALLNSILDHSPVSIFVKDVQGNYMLANQHTAAVMHRTPQEMIGQCAYDLYPPGVASVTRAIDQHIMRTGKPKRSEQLIPQDGEVHTYLDTSFPLYNRHGDVYAIGSISMDITERKRIEETLRQTRDELERRFQERSAALIQSEARSRALLDALPDSMFLYRRDGIVLDCKQGVTVGHHIPGGDVVGQNWCDVMPEDFSALCRTHTNNLLTTDEPQVFEWHIDSSAYEIRLARCGEDEVLAIVRDVTSRTQVEDALRASEQLYRTLVETAPSAVLLTDMDNIIQFCNQQAVTLFGYKSMHDVVGKQGSELVASDLAGDTLIQMRTIVRLGSTGTLEYELCRSDGSRFTAEMTSALVKDAQGSPGGLIIVINDITERKQAEQSLARTYAEIARLNAILMRSRNLLRAIFDNLEDGLVLLDGNGVVQEINRALASLLDSRPEHMVQEYWEYLYPQIAPGFPGDLLADVHTTDRRAWQRRYQRPDGTTYVLDFQTITLFGEQQEVEQIILRVIDVTENIRLQAKVIESERFAASGRMAASVAHEINTPLQALQNSLKLAQIANDEDRETFLTYARQEIQRVGRIVHQFLDLYRPSAARVGPVHINTLIERILLLIGKRIRDQKVRVEQDLVPNLPELEGRADELLQVFLNLIVNALDVMPDGGMLRIKTERCHPVGSERGQVAVSITDSGSGIAPEMLNRIFDSFVTTKEEGIGLGLAISTQIVQQHNGTITVESEPGVGSTFTVTIPLHVPDSEEQKGEIHDHESTHSDC